MISTGDILREAVKQQTPQGINAKTFIDQGLLVPDEIIISLLKEKIKEVIGTCNSMGVMVEGKPAFETIKDINGGAFKEKIESGKTELSAEELKVQEEERKKLEAEVEKRRSEFESKAEAMKREKELKSHQGREFIRNNL